MTCRPLNTILLCLLATAGVSAVPLPGRSGKLFWSTVVNNNDAIPPLFQRNFNSYNPPSVNAYGRVVLRARSRGGPPLGPASHGIYLRDMSKPDGPIVSILDRSSAVPEPNNLGALFVETPSFPRIDMWSDTIATRGNHQPVWNFAVENDSVSDEEIETRAGTTGIYTNPFGPLITGATKLGDVPELSFFEVPEFPGTRFEVFPGAPAVTEKNTIVFKGNSTVGAVEKTGVYFRRLADRTMPVNGSLLAPAGGTAPVVLVANNTHSWIPGTFTVFGSTAPPSAAGDRMVFAGFDDEDHPTLGGIYLAPLEPQPDLTTLVSIGERVPDEAAESTFHQFGENLAFDGYFVGFWGAWGTATRTVRLYCPEEGNRDRIAYCNQNLVCADGTIEMDPNSICDDSNDPRWPICYQEKQIPVEQGIFVHSLDKRETRTVAKTGAEFDDFLFWNYSGRTPCTGGHGQEGEDDGEPVRWRSSAFVAVSGLNLSTLHTAFKAAKSDRTGIYIARGPKSVIQTVLDTTMEGQTLDPEAPADSRIIELGFEREGLRREWLAVNAKMGIEGGTEDEGMAGVYLTRVPTIPRAPFRQPIIEKIARDTGIRDVHLPPWGKTGRSNDASK